MGIVIPFPHKMPTASTPSPVAPLWECHWDYDTDSFWVQYVDTFAVVQRAVGPFDTMAIARNWVVQNGQGLTVYWETFWDDPDCGGAP